jgi:gamma-glutamylcysteine synthetase
MDESNRQINFNSLKKSATSLLAAIAIMDKSDRQINFNSLKKSVSSLPVAIAVMDESDRQINFNSLKKSVTSLSAAIGALSSPLGPNPENDLVTYLYSVSTPIDNMDMSGCQISFNSFNKSVISLRAAIGTLCSPLGPHLESDIETYLYSGSTLITIKTSPIVGWLCPSSQL